METKEICQQWLNDAQQALITEYDSEGRRASGGFEKSLSNEVIETTDGLRLVQYGVYYAYWMVKGRKPGKFPPINVIQKWIKDKGIKGNGISDKSLAFLIARKISREGYSGKPLIENVFTDSRIDSLLNQINTNFVANAKIEITQMLKK